ncbi:MAG: 3-hydroxyacyl-CoA dehydrogenase family protein [Deltaproteobacteria bacterium]|jgi:3-hydroxyacyl-CoA dehydrogenase|nr:3-hydroxyacyl-CoA dehydrogenase family protein [Deltaproteobacteria bacterium]MBW2495705.1 3-hydroxyacyl-CoA dehydrogenase family protein [Deltaproteobacteria bacterium]
MRIGIVGAGVMGSGIAQVLATAGNEAVCADVSTEALEKARANVTTGRYGLGNAVERGKLERAEAEAALARLHFTDDLEEAVSASQLVIECVPEDLGVKVELFRRLDRIAPEETVLASNSSGFPVAAMAAATDRPTRVLTWHWASPPVVMKFAEIVVTPATDPAAVELVRETALACGKHPVVVKDVATSWGYVANRIYAAMMREAARVVEEGVASHEEVNQLMVDCYRWPVGPFAMIAGAKKGFGD